MSSRCRTGIGPAMSRAAPAPTWPSPTITRCCIGSGCSAARPRTAQPARGGEEMLDRLRLWRLFCRFGAALLLLLLGTGDNRARADAVSDFYRGKLVTLV